jgi:hypothetical protein
MKMEKEARGIANISNAVTSIVDLSARELIGKIRKRTKISKFHAFRVIPRPAFVVGFPFSQRIRKKDSPFLNDLCGETRNPTRFFGGMNFRGGS